MLCQHCQQREATVRMTRIVNGIRQTMYLCEQCAARQQDGGLGQFLSDFMGFGAPAIGSDRLSRRLTNRAKLALAKAEQIAKERKSAYLNTEHLLLALFQVDGLASRMLKELNLNADVLAEAIDDEANRGTEYLGLAPRTKRAIQQALEESSRMGVNFVDTEHLLLGLAAEEESQAAHWLLDMGEADVRRLRQLLITMLQQARSNNGEFAAPEGGENQAGSNPNSKTPVLDQFGRDLTDQARQGKLDPVVGRNKEIQRVIQILSRRTKNNPVLIGEPGVGKTAIVEGLAQLIVEGRVPETLINKRVVSVDMSGMVAGAKYRGEFEERMKKLVEEVRADHHVILFIDEVHTIVGAGAAEGSIDAANILKPALARGELQCIGATTLNEYRTSIEKDSALERRFQPVMVGEPLPEDALQILRGLRDRYEAHHRVQITDAALEAAVRLSARYIPDRFLPDKAIDLIDEAASKTRLMAFTAPPDLKQKEEALAQVQKEKDAAINAQEYEEAARLRDKEKALTEEIEASRKGWKGATAARTQVVDKEQIAEVLSDWTGIPVASLDQEEADKLLHLEEKLHERVVGQEEAVSSIARAMRRARSGLKDGKRPIGSFIFLGPTGVGKTELAKALANAMFGSDDAMVRIDMSEYMEKYAVSRLVGAPPGYVGYDEGGQLTEAVRRKPYSVVLLDEIEKAHPDVFNILLQVLDDGRLTDSTGRVVDFRNTIIIMTSNVGATEITRNRSMGFGSGEEEGSLPYSRMKEQMLEALKKVFRPEFLNRVDETVVFHPLEKEQICAIAGLLLAELGKRMAQQELTLTYDHEVEEYLAKVGFDPVYGARPLRRAILTEVEDPISEGILRKDYQAGDIIRVQVAEDKLAFTKEKPGEVALAQPEEEQKEEKGKEE